MTDAEIARPLELELQKLFGEDSYRLERKIGRASCRERV